MRWSRKAISPGRCGPACNKGGVKKKHLTLPLFYSMIPKVIEMEKKLTQTYLYDFYGELLTDHQREIYEDFVLNDLSLSEIAQDAGISRQGVHDLVKRCDRILEGYEEKLHLLERFLSTKEKVCRIQSLSRKYQEQREPDQRQADQKDSEKVMVMAEIEAISNEILEEL